MLQSQFQLSKGAAIHHSCVEHKMMIILGGKSRPFFPTEKSREFSLSKADSFFSFNFGYLECQLEGLTLKNVFACKFLKGLFMMPIVDFYSHFLAALGQPEESPLKWLSLFNILCRAFLWPTIITTPYLSFLLWMTMFFLALAYKIQKPWWQLDKRQPS